MIKSLCDFAVPSDRPWMVYGVAGTAGPMLAGILVAILGHRSTVNLAFLLVVACVVCLGYCAFREVSQEGARADRFAGYLAGIDVATLRWACTSPEFDAKTRACILLFLNARHPGWSREGD